MSSPSTETPAVPKTMHAWQVVRRGLPETALEPTSSAPVPSRLKDGEVLVKVGAAALNPVGYVLMGAMPNFMAGRPLAAAECEISRTVITSASPFHRPCDAVFGFLDLNQQKRTKQGALSQYTRIPGEALSPRPLGMSSTEAAGVALVAQTAYLCLVDIARVQPGMHVFVNGGSSAVGAFGIQIAKARGAIVWASASGKNEAFVREQGAEEFFDYTSEPLSTSLARATKQRNVKFDVLFDAVGLQDPALFVHSPAYLAPDGVFVTGGFSHRLLWLGLLGS